MRHVSYQDIQQSQIPMHIATPQGSDDPNLKKIVKKAFKGFKGIVYSSGEITNKNQGLLEVHYSTINGISSSPVVCNSTVVGVYLGGPPLHGQRELLKLGMMVNCDKIEEAYQDSKILNVYAKEYSQAPFASLLKGFKIILFWFQVANGLDLGTEYSKPKYHTLIKTLKTNPVKEYRKEKHGLLDQIHMCIYSQATLYKRPEEFTSNVD